MIVPNPLNLKFPRKQWAKIRRWYAPSLGPVKGESWDPTCHVSRNDTTCAAARHVMYPGPTWHAPQPDIPRSCCSINFDESSEAVKTMQRSGTFLFIIIPWKSITLLPLKNKPLVNEWTLRAYLISAWSLKWKPKSWLPKEGQYGVIVTWENETCTIQHMASVVRLVNVHRTPNAS